MLKLTGALRQKTDYSRWANPRSIYSSWEPRTKMAADLVPNHSRVIEFGAATRALEKYLDPSCIYTASDLVDRGPGTIVCDLNERPLPDLRADAYDVAVFMGVLEYVRDMPSMIDWLAKHFSVCVLSYACAKANRHPLRGKFESISRLNKGWMNNYCEDELRTLFRDRGFVLLRNDDWEDQRLFAFSQRPKG
jgi:Methyltransferase domain